MSTLQTQLVKKTSIIDSGDFNLSANRYLEKVEINSDYEVVSITDTFQLVKQSNKIKKNNYLNEGLIPIIDQSSDFIAGYANAENGIIDEVHPLIIFGDHTRVVKFINFKFLPGADGVKILKPNIDIMLPKFLYNMLKFIKLKNLGYSRHFKLLKEVMIPLPPLEIQEQIVKEIEGYQQIIDGCRQVVENYKPVIDIDSSWEVVNLEEISTKITDGTHKTPKYTESGVPFLRVTDITKSNNSKKFISKEEHLDLIKRCNPEVGDLLYSKNGTIGVAKLVDWNYDFSIFVSLCLIKPNNQRILSSYLEVILNSDNVFRQAMSLSKSGTVTNLHLVEIKKFKIPLPSKEIQKEIVETIEQERKVIEGNKELIQIYEKKINDKIKELF